MNKHPSHTPMAHHAGVGYCVVKIDSSPGFAIPKGIAFINTPHQLVKYLVELMEVRLELARASDMNAPELAEVMSFWEDHAKSVLRLLDMKLDIEEHDEITATLNAIKSAFEIQFGREEGKFHITSSVMVTIWNDALVLGKNYLSATSQKE